VSYRVESRHSESFDISPDGRRVILATIQEARNVMLAEGVPGF
jgi:hypothetical protein